MAENATQIEDPEDDQGEDGKRQRASIAFPYTDYEGAAEVANAIHGNVGHGTCSTAQLAPWMSQSAKSSGFRTQLSAARLFGLIESDSPESLRLTTLGTRVVDPAQARVAKAESFLKVPLFAKLFEKYKTGVVPPSAALEREIVGLGVSEKQKARARQVFESSAQQTGFRDHGTNRLVMPAVMVPPPATPPGEDVGAGGGNGGGGGSGGQYHPFIQGLLQKLPAPDTDWPIEARGRWLTTAANIFGLMYSQADNDAGVIEVKVIKL